MGSDNGRCCNPDVHLKEKIYSGAEATVWLADFQGEQVIAKERRKKNYLEKELWNSIGKQRLKREVKALNTLRSAGIDVPRVLYADAGKGMIIMEEIKGKTLHDLGSETKAGKLYSKAAEVLAKIHSLGFWHRDFNPKNLIVSGKKLFVIDCGISKQPAKNDEMAYDLLTMLKATMDEKNRKEFEKEYRKLNPVIWKSYEKIAGFGRYK